MGKLPFFAILLLVGLTFSLDISIPANASTKTENGITITTSDWNNQIYRDYTLHYYIISFSAMTVPFSVATNNIQGGFITKDINLYPITSTIPFDSVDYFNTSYFCWNQKIDENCSEYFDNETQKTITCEIEEKCLYRIWNVTKKFNRYITGIPAKATTIGVSSYVLEIRTSNFVRSSWSATFGGKGIDPDINSCGNLTSANTVYTAIAPLYHDTQTCINISAANVTLNCAGYSITGGNLTGTIGVYVSGHNATIGNCSISNFSRAVWFNSGADGKVLNTRINQTFWRETAVLAGNGAHRLNISDIQINTSDSTGIGLTGSQNTTINCGDGNLINGSNNGQAVYGVYSTQTNISIENCNISGYFHGIYTTGASVYVNNNNVSANNVTNGYAIFSQGTTGMLSNLRLKLSVLGGTTSAGLYVSGALTNATNITIETLATTTLTDASSFLRLTNILAIDNNNANTGFTSGTAGTYSNVTVLLNGTGSGGNALLAAGNNGNYTDCLFYGNNTQGGIILNGAQNNTITRTNFSSRTSVGLQIRAGARNNSINNCNISSMTGYALQIYAQAPQNNITNSRITGAGTLIAYVVTIASGSNNTVFNNTNITALNTTTAAIIGQVSGTIIDGGVITSTNKALKGIESQANTTTIMNTVISNFTIGLTLTDSNDSLIRNNTFINNTLNHVSVTWNSHGNLFYWNNFTTDTRGVFVNDSNGTNFYNNSEGNIWGDVFNGSVEITGTSASIYNPAWYVGSAGAGYPYSNNTSLEVSSGVVDNAPLTPTGSSSDAPLISYLNVTPKLASVFTSLQCDIIANTTKGWDMNASVSWYLDGVNQTAMFSIFTGLANNTNTAVIWGAVDIVGEWACAVQAFDGLKYSSLNFSENTTVKPAINITDISIQPSSPDETSNLSCNITVLSYFSSLVNISYEWRDNGTNRTDLAGTITNIQNNTPTLISNQTAGTFANDSNVSCAATAYDILDNTTWNFSANVTIVSSLCVYEIAWSNNMLLDGQFINSTHLHIYYEMNASPSCFINVTCFMNFSNGTIAKINYSTSNNTMNQTISGIEAMMTYGTYCTIYSSSGNATTVPTRFYPVLGNINEGLDIGATLFLAFVIMSCGIFGVSLSMETASVFRTAMFMFGFMFLLVTLHIGMLTFTAIETEMTVLYTAVMWLFYLLLFIFMVYILLMGLESLKRTGRRL